MKRDTKKIIDSIFVAGTR